MKLVIPAALGPITSNIAEADHSEWAASASYALGDRVMVAAAHRVYESALGNNTGKNPASHPEAWIDAGPTNRWAMFAADAGLRTLADSGAIAVTFAPAGAIDALGLLDFDASTIRLEITNGEGVLYDETRSVAGEGACVFMDLPHEAGATIAVTLEAPAGGPAAVGKLLAGVAQDLGDTETGVSVALTDYSRRQTDDFGVTTVTRRGWAKRFSVRTILPADRADAVQQLAARVRAVPALWIGSEAHGSLIAYGYFKDFRIELQLGSASHCSIEVEGLPSADGLLPVLDPAAQGSSNFQVIDPVRVTEAVLASSNVPEDDAPLWNTATTYALGAKVRWGRRIYESVIPANLNKSPLTGSADWLDIGPTNRWAMFDQALGSATTRSGPIVVRFTLPEAVQGLAVLDTDAASVQVAAPGYDRVLAPEGGSSVFLDLAAIAGQTLTVTITPESGQPVSVGTLLFGPVLGLGVTENRPTIGITDYSRKVVDDFGNTTAVPRAWAKNLTARTLIATDAADVVLRRLARLRATPAVWIADQSFDSLTIYGFFRDFTVELSENTSLCSFNIEGLTAAPVIDAPALLPPSWADIQDDDPAHPKPADGATVGAPPGTSVGGKPVEEVLDELAQLDADMAAAGLVIADLIDTYGTTASANAAWQGAVAARDAAVEARNAAEARALEAADHESASEGYAIAAGNERTAAATARGEAVQAKEDALGASSAAAESATLSARARDDAGDYAEAALSHSEMAGTHAGASGNSALAAADSKMSAEMAEGQAVTAAERAEGFSVSASDAAAASRQSAVLSATIGQGALNKNVGFDDYPSGAVGAFPAGWTLWQGTDHYRVPDPQGGFALRIPAAGGANVGILQNLSDVQLLTQNGYYVIEADVFLHAGDFAGAGVLFTPRSQTNTALQNLLLHFNSEADISGAVQAAPTLGRAYSFRKLVQVTGEDPRGFILYAMTRHASFNGGNGTAGDIEWRKLLVRPASQAEIRAKTVLEPMAATVTSQQTAITTIESSLASQGTTLNSLGITVNTQASALTTVQNGIATMAGQWTTAIDANGVTIGRIKLDGTGFTSSFEVLASVFRVVNPGGGAALTWSGGILWNKGASHSVILGQNFGNQSNLLLWAGPNPSSPSAATKANGIFWIDRNGNAYFGGSLSAGVLKNSAQTTLLTADAEVIVGPFSTNGDPKSVIVSYAYNYEYASGGTTGDYSYPMTAQIQVHRSVNGGAWTLVQTLNCTGGYTHIGSTGFGYAQHFYHVNGAVTFNDSTPVTGNLRFRAKLVDFKINGVTQTTSRPNGSSQTLSLTSIEE